MTANINIDEPRPRGTIICRQVSGPLLSEAEHFRKCPLCGGYIDMRDWAWIDEHQQPRAAPGTRSPAVAGPQAQLSSPTGVGISPLPQSRNPLVKRDIRQDQAWVFLSHPSLSSYCAKIAFAPTCACHCKTNTGAR
jgi:hypothetical protein